MNSYSLIITKSIKKRENRRKEKPYMTEVTSVRQTFIKLFKKIKEVWKTEISKSIKRPALFKKAVTIGAMTVTEPAKSLNLAIEKEILRIFLIIAKRTRTPAMISTVLIM